MITQPGKFAVGNLLMILGVTWFMAGMFTGGGGDAACVAIFAGPIAALIGADLVRGSIAVKHDE